MRSFLAILIALLACACGDNLTPPADPNDDKTQDANDTADGIAVSCLPNLDSQIEARELQTVLGVAINYQVATSVAVDVAGQDQGNGQFLWDWSQSYPAETTFAMTADAVIGKWYDAHFPTATFTTPFDTAGTLDAIYRRDDQEISLLGIASHEQDPANGRTLMVYQDPIVLYRFPITTGQQWIAASDVREGLFYGLPYAGRDIYDVHVDAIGTLRLTDMTFAQAHRVRVRVTLQPSVGQSTTQQQVSFLFECFGEIARATSQPNTAEADFTTAAEVRRLGLSSPQ